MTTKVPQSMLDTLGAFTGGIIPQDPTIKQALQSLETFLKSGNVGNVSSVSTTVPPNASDLSSAITLLNAIKQILITSGLVVDTSVPVSSGIFDLSNSNNGIYIASTF